MRAKLTPMPDFITRHAEEYLAAAKEVIARTNRNTPILRYFRAGQEFSLPMDYRLFVLLGRAMRRLESATAIISHMGPEFAFLAAELAERSEAAGPVIGLVDQVAFVGEVGHVLYHVHPQAFFLSMPVRVAGSMADIERVANLALGGVPQAAEPNAIMVTACNRVRSYVTFSEFSVRDDGKLVYSKPKVFDSFAGSPNENALFAEIYAPGSN